MKGQLSKLNIVESLQRSLTSSYKVFDQIDGSHPLQEIMPESCVMYPVRELNEGEVVYFNFTLAKEMGLIDKSHPEEMNSKLHKKLIETFSIRIINEYDQKQKNSFKPSLVKSRSYMATRYLQLQHSNKQGKTSGDGRGIWNGHVSHNGKVWDVSSRGTGVTCLAPGAVEANKPLKTGGTGFGYGCGLAEIDELVACAIQSEIMHNKGVSTERVLCVINLGKGYGIGVRASQNLIRPAHLFLFLKQNRHRELKEIFNFFIQRQVQNKRLQLTSKNGIWDQALKQISTDFGKFVAHLDSEYIFAWLDWDGDNVLADAGIIDYGSIRQFGIRHDQYRYDDVQRFSTNLNEQVGKAKEIIMVFCQLVDYLKTGKKKPQHNFKNSKSVKNFEASFENELRQLTLQKAGFSKAEVEALTTKQTRLVDGFMTAFRKIETEKSRKSFEKVADGINKPALFNGRKLLRNLPLLVNEFKISPTQKSSLDVLQEIFKMTVASHGKKRSAKAKHLALIENVLSEYAKLTLATEVTSSLKTLGGRSLARSSELVLTGNALIEVVDEIVKSLKSNPEKVQNLIASLIEKEDEHKLTELDSSEGKAAISERRLYLRLAKLITTNAESI